MSRGFLYIYLHKNIPMQNGLWLKKNLKCNLTCYAAQNAMKLTYDTQMHKNMFLTYLFIYLLIGINCINISRTGLHKRF